MEKVRLDELLNIYRKIRLLAGMVGTGPKVAHDFVRQKLRIVVPVAFVAGALMEVCTE
jgi:hypothetical protein